MKSLPFEIHPAAELFPMLEGEAFEEFVRDIEQNGIKEPIVIWQGKLLDGRNRSMACLRLGMNPLDYACDLESEDVDPVQYVLSLNLHRRHLTTSQRAMIAAEVAKLGRGGDRRSDEFKGQNCTLKQAADLLSVGERTAKEARAVLTSGDDETIRAVKSGEMSVHKAAAVVSEKRLPHVSHNSGENEWYTPEPYVSAAREVLDGIDLDPASSDAANDVIQAQRYFTVDDDGLSKDWRGKVWLNPPYGTGLIGQFAEKLVDEYLTGNVTEAIVLVNNATETSWFQMLSRTAAAVCFPQKRIRFRRPEGDSASPLQGQAFFYLGNRTSEFCRVFEAFGEVLGKAGARASEPAVFVEAFKRSPSPISDLKVLFGVLEPTHKILLRDWLSDEGVPL